jgi:hypothetical protein
MKMGRFTAEGAEGAEREKRKRVKERNRGR